VRLSEGVVAVLATLAPLSTALALDVQELAVRHLAPRYEIRMVYETQATAARMRAVLTDYVRLKRLSPHIISAQAEPLSNGTLRVRTHTRGCVLFLCVDLNRIEDVSETPGVLSSQIVPNEDFRAGYTECRFEEHEGRTRVVYTSTVEPGFFIPPVVGPPLAKRGLKQGLLRAVKSVERLAMEPAS
jgi:hypothetical protein